MSRGCGDNAAAFTDVTASAAAQKIDFIVNTAIVAELTISIAKQIYHNLPTCSIYFNGRRLHLVREVRGCGGMSSAKVSKVSTMSRLRYQEDTTLSEELPCGISLTDRVLEISSV